MFLDKSCHAVLKEVIETFMKIKRNEKIDFNDEFGFLGVSCTKILWIDKEPNIITAVLQTYS